MINEKNLKKNIPIVKLEDLTQKELQDKLEFLKETKKGLIVLNAPQEDMDSIQEDIDIVSKLID